MKAKGVFFDLYGTLLIYGDMDAAWADWLRVFHDRLSRHGLSMALEKLGMACDGFFSREVPFSLNDGRTLYERRLLLLCEDLDISVPTDSIRDLADSTALAWQKHHRVDPEAAGVLSELQEQFRLAMISNYDHPPVLHAYVKELGLDRYFSTIVVSAEAGVEKPAPAIFEIALKAEGLRPEEAVFVGDMALDVEGARAAGMQPVLIRRDERDLDRLVSDYHSGEDEVGGEKGVAELEVQTISRLSELTGLVESP